VRGRIRNGKSSPRGGSGRNQREERSVIILVVRDWSSVAVVMGRWKCGIANPMEMDLKKTKKDFLL
jgi:stage III sporulation protein SpoIIIAA